MFDRTYLAFRAISLTLVLIASLIPFLWGQTESDSQPNILFISVDDLNDWITPLGGHPNAKTPNFERLAEMGIDDGNSSAPIGRL